MAIISIFLATLLATSSFTYGSTVTQQQVNNIPVTNTQGSVAQQTNIGGQQQIGVGPDIGPQQQVGPVLGGLSTLSQQQQQHIPVNNQQQQQLQQILALQLQQQQQQRPPVINNTPPQQQQQQQQTRPIINNQPPQQIPQQINNNIPQQQITQQQQQNNNEQQNNPRTISPNPNNRHSGINIGQTINPYINNNGIGLGNINNINNINNNQQSYINNPASNIIIGTYQWIGQDASIYTLFICTGINGDRMIYSSIQRTNINAFGLPDNSYTFAFIVARGIMRLNADGATASLRGFRLYDAFGIDDNFNLLLTYSRCDNLYQLQINDETYTLVKISNANPQQQQCMRPSYVYNFNNLGQINNNNNNNNNNGFATFQSYSPLHWKMPNKYNLGNNGFNNIFTLRKQLFNNNINNNNLGGYNNGYNNNFGIFGCGGYQNPLTSQFFPGRRRYFGNYGPYGNLYWSNSLLVNTFDDDLFDDDFGWDCQRGIEFGIFLDDGDFWENQQCYNKPTVGWAGRLKPIKPLTNWGINQCPMPNIAQLNHKFYPGWTPLPMHGFFGWN